MSNASSSRSRPLSDAPLARAARARRLERGVETEEKAKAFSKASLQGMLQLPLLEEIDQLGGKARPGELYERLAARLGYPQEELSTRRSCNDGQSYNVFEQQVRWARQTAIAQGLLASPSRGIWELADPGYAKLQRVRRGTVVLLYRLDDGLALWAHAEDAASVIEKESVSLILTSPPYPVVNRAYGTMDVPTWLSWMSDLTSMWKDLLTEDGTLCVNVMPVFVPGTPSLSPYIERFVIDALDRHSLHLADRWYWQSPTKLANIQWSVKERVRPRNAMEHVLLFSKSPFPSWDIDRLPKEPYAPRSAQRQASDLAREKARRPSGYDINPQAFARGDGRIPDNVIVSGGVSGTDAYSKRCRAAGEEPHPARFPEILPRTIIQLATNLGDTVYDPMAGSGTTAKVASELGRRFITSEPMLAYGRSSRHRFIDRPDFMPSSIITP